MSKLKQDQEFTDKSGNLYKIYDCRLCIKALGIWNELKFDLKGVTILVNEGELIPVKPKTVADEMLEWLDDTKDNTANERRSDYTQGRYDSLALSAKKLCELIAKHE